MIHMQSIKNSKNRPCKHFSDSSQQMGTGYLKNSHTGSEDLPNELEHVTSPSADNGTTSSTSSSTESEVEAPTHSTIDSAFMNTSFELCSVSPLKRHGKSKQTQAAEARRKILKTANVLLSKANQESTSFKICDKQDELLAKEDKEKVEHSDHLCLAINEKIQSVNRSTKIQLLTLILDSWSVEKAAQCFGVTKYQVKKARKMKEKGILLILEKKKGRALSEETKEFATNFYQDEEVTQVMPGKKDCISVSKNVHKQKHLVLYNFKELFSMFKTRYPSTTVGFSFFCSSIPKWCVLAGASGTHAVCVCTIHQNTKLLITALNTSEKYKDMMKLLVCSTDNKDCMIHRCSNCPSSDILRNHLLNIIGEYDDDTEITYKQWVTTDQSTLSQITTPVQEFVSVVINSLEKLTMHLYIAKSQSRYLRHLKNNIDSHTVILLVDFAENFAFTVQDEMQPYHSNSSQATLHPVCMYYRADGHLHCHSFCIISDDMDHDVSLVHQIQKEWIQHV